MRMYYSERTKMKNRKQRRLITARIIRLLKKSVITNHKNSHNLPLFRCSLL